MTMADYHHEYKMQEREHYSAEKVEKYFTPGGFKSGIPHKAENILDRGVENLIGRRIITFSQEGDYQDGAGPGFLGFLLDEDRAKNLKKELIVITIHSADFFTLLDDNWMYNTDPHDKEHIPIARRPALGEPSQFHRIVEGSIIREANLQSEFLKLTIQSADGAEHLLEILNKDSRLSPFPGLTYIENGEVKHRPRVAMKPGDHIGNYIIFMEENGQIYV